MKTRQTDRYTAECCWASNWASSSCKTSTYHIETTQRQTGWKTDRQTDRKTDMQPDRQEDRQVLLFSKQLGLFLLQAKLILHTDKTDRGRQTRQTATGPLLAVSQVHTTYRQGRQTDRQRQPASNWASSAYATHIMFRSSSKRFTGCLSKQALSTSCQYLFVTHCPCLLSVWSASLLCTIHQDNSGPPLTQELYVFHTSKTKT